LSHKKKDFRAANQIRDVLRINSAGHIDVFMSENITKGDDWQGTIEQAPYESDWFVLLFSGGRRRLVMVPSRGRNLPGHGAPRFRASGRVPSTERRAARPAQKYQAVKC
jgi:hypothetical protein